MDSEVNNALVRIRTFVERYCAKSGTVTHPDKEVTEAVVVGLAANLATLGKPLCPCRFYPDKEAETKHRTWICACDDMQICKYCHCLLFVTPEGKPVTEYLPDIPRGPKNLWSCPRSNSESRKASPRHGRKARRRTEIAAFLIIKAHPAPRFIGGSLRKR